LKKNIFLRPFLLYRKRDYDLKILFILKEHKVSIDHAVKINLIPKGERRKEKKR